MLTVLCPKCGTPIHLVNEPNLQNNVRRRVNVHLMNCSPGLGVRERSLLCDKVSEMAVMVRVVVV